jgi:hypothetical protein
MSKPTVAAKIKGRVDLEWVGIVRNGPVNSRVVRLDEDDEEIAGIDSFLVPNRQLYDRRPLFQNLRRRTMQHPEGKTYSMTVAIKDEPQPTRYFIVQKGHVESRLVPIGPDGKSSGDSFAISNDFIVDRHQWHEPVEVMTKIDERGVLVVPAEIRRAAGITGVQAVAVEQRDGGIFIRPRKSPINGQENP